MIPMFKGKKIDSDEYVKGFLIKENTGHFIQNDKGNGFKIIDPSTLEISFDNGESFDSINDIADLFCDYTPKEVLFKLEIGTPRDCHNCHHLNGKSCLNDKIPDSDTPKYIEFSGCGLQIYVNK